MEKQKAIDKLQKQIGLLEPLMHQRRFSPQFKKWYRDTEILIEHVFGKEGRHLTDFSEISYSLGGFSSSTPDCEFQAAFNKGLDNAREILKSMIDEIIEWGIDQYSQSLPNVVSVIENICKRFHLVVRQLRDRHDGRPSLSVEDEYDVQDLLHALLLIDFDDIRPEEWTPSYAGSSSRMDFLLKKEQIVIETKKTRNGLAAKDIGEQLIIDIEKYRGHPDCKILICFVYDPEGRIGNPKGIENDLNRVEGDLMVKVIIAPTGR